MAITSGLTTAKAGEPAGSLELSGNTVTFAGDWTLAHYPALNRQVSQFKAENASLKPEFSRLGRLDTAGASLMVKMLGAEPVLAALEQPSLPEAQQALLKAVAESMCESAPAPATVNPLLNMLAITGEKVTRLTRLLWLLSGFIGQTLSTLFYILPRPKRWRFTPFVAKL